MPPSTSTRRLRRLPQLLLFLSFVAWYFGARVLAGSAASGLAFRLRLVTGRVVLEACFHLFLLVVGFLVLDGVARRRASLRELTNLPRRPTERQEWAKGLLLGWGMIAVGLVPLVVTRRMHSQLSLAVSDFGTAAATLAVLSVATLAHEITFRGYPFRCLIDAVGESAALVLVVIGAGISAWSRAWVPGTAVIASMLLTLLLSLAALRTRAVWLAWGLHFGLVAVGSVLFGMPFGEGTGFSTLVRSSTNGPDWLTGGSFGPAAAWFSVVVLVAAVPVLYRLTRDYAWHYTHAPIVAAGYAVSVAPPEAHRAMEQQAAQAPALVQILATTPTSFSASRPKVPASVDQGEDLGTNLS